MYRLVVIGASLLLLAVQAPARADETPVKALVDAVNEVRRAHGLETLEPEARLAAAARAHAGAMAASDCVDHVCGEGGDLADRLARAGYPYRSAAENVAAGYARAQDVVASWMESAGHRRNILSAEVSEVGAGRHSLQDACGTRRFCHYWAMIFGARF